MHDSRESGTRIRQARPFALLALAVGALAACDSLLEVELPASLTEDALDNPASAETQVYSAMAFFECAYSDLNFLALGFEDFWERLTGVAAPADYQPNVGGGTCDSSNNSSNWHNYTHISRAMAASVHDRLVTEWTVSQVPSKPRLQVLAALYAGAAIELMGDFLCEATIDAGPLLTPDQTLLAGEAWIQTALDHITADGDFAISDGISTSARTTAYALRARMRWARGDAAGALADAAQVPMGFTAWVTREAGSQRRNKVAASGYIQPYAGGHVDVIDWWDVPDRTNPVTDQPWPTQIPFTGYTNLGILPDGRAITAAQLPIRTTVDAGAVSDPRVATVLKQPAGGVSPQPVPAKYTNEADDIPWVSWREIWLIRAELQGSQAAIDLVNEIRSFRGLPQVTYADPNDAAQIREMVLEEKRREMFVEGGRWWATKILNTDILWFPRALGVFPVNGWALFGGVRQVMPDSEFESNPNLQLIDQGTGCPTAQAPVEF